MSLAIGWGTVGSPSAEYVPAFRNNEGIIVQYGNDRGKMLGMFLIVREQVIIIHPNDLELPAWSSSLGRRCLE